MSLFGDCSHRRFNPLTREWVIVSPHRTQRPWQGQMEKKGEPAGLAYDPECYLCPGNARAGGAVNPRYESTFVFDNDFAALKPDAGGSSINEGGLIRAEAEAGLCRVICFSPRHDLTVSQMSVGEICKVIDVWGAQYRELGALSFVNSVQIFENRGAMMGASNPHPHCQIWASASVPNEPAKEGAAFLAHGSEKGGCLLCDYLELEQRSGERIVHRNAHFVVLVPFWAVWPFEAMILPVRHRASLDGLSAEETEGLADAMHALTQRYDALFDTPFPYSMGFHQAPTDGRGHDEWHFHAHYYPPLLRSASVRKFMVGFEMLGSPQRDITPETAADMLRRAART